ncbi:MAG: energy transducer TonB [Kordiimonas sp.]|nr:energy transducer TonB [Kordiimonas sp.]
MNKFLKTIAAIAVSGMAFASVAQAQSSEVVNTAKSLDELLELVRAGKVAESKDNRRREQEFINNKAAQQKLLGDAVSTRKSEERRSSKLEADYQANEVKLGNLEEALQKRMGSLKELFGVLQQVSGDARGIFQNSIISAEFPNREAFLSELIEKTASSSKLPTIEEIERLWFEIQREMTESGKVTRFDATIIKPNGDKDQREVVRVGTFNLIADGKYLEFQGGGDEPKLLELVRQPQGRFLETASNLQSANAGFTAFGLDPSRGAILSLMVQAPDLAERIDQGGFVGYFILAVGVVGMLFILERFIYLYLVNRKVKAQVRSDVVSQNNPLGRVLSVYDANKGVDTETLELKLDEAILKETPALERFLTLIKIISAVAPLLGLLGTVTGMINTFQAMTLFGTGDPKLMAGGISQALVTTVLGLVVALPTLFFHAIVAGWSKGVIHTLEEQSAGIIAVHAEQQGK